ncbi:regulatory protein RecX [Alkalilimnicola sp. S0819]|nr:regulatory protein RecX [Alkalilimnicola sp. S0819]MPQ17499.1 hypothetical protein [Alkalilimnicola sp. S0819]
MRLLARREHSRRELARKLVQRGFQRDCIEPALDALTAENLLSEERYTEQYVRARREQGYGPLRILAELGERGIREGLAEPFLHGHDDWAERAAQARHKRFGAEGPGNMKERARQYRFLAQRGFSAEQIRVALQDAD